MKRKIDKNSPASRSNPWRMMVGAALLFLMTSMGSFAQSGSMTMEELQVLKKEIYKVELKLASPLVQADAAATADLQNLLADLQAKYTFHARTLKVNSPAEYASLES